MCQWQDLLQYYNILAESCGNLGTPPQTPQVAIYEFLLVMNQFSMQTFMAEKKEFQTLYQ